LQDKVIYLLKKKVENNVKLFLEQSKYGANKFLYIADSLEDNFIKT